MRILEEFGGQTFKDIQVVLKIDLRHALVFFHALACSMWCSRFKFVREVPTTNEDEFRVEKFWHNTPRTTLMVLEKDAKVGKYTPLDR